MLLHWLMFEKRLSVAMFRWIQSWATLVTLVSSYPASRSRLILDFIDFPDKAGLQWEANNGLPGSGILLLPSSPQPRKDCAVPILLP